MTHDLQYLVLARGPERYIFIVEDTAAHRTLALRTFAQFAADPELSFDWWDAGRMAADAWTAQRSLIA